MNTEVLEKYHPLFSKLSFVLQARSTNDCREYMQILHIEEDKAICTDGRRLHIFTGPIHLEPGDYNVITATKSQLVLTLTTDWTFPDWKKIMPDKSEYKKTEGKLNLDYASLKKTELNELSRQYFAFIKNTGCLIDLTLFNDLSGYTWEVFYKAVDKVVLFESSYLTVVIAPMIKAV